MKNIDFLPQRFREQHAVQRARWWRVGLVGLFGAIIASVTAVQYAQRYGVEAELAILNLQHQEALALEGRLQKLQRELAADCQEAELFAFLRHAGPRTQLLAAVVSRLPEEVQLQSLQCARVIEEGVEEEAPQLPAPGSPEPDVGAPAERKKSSPASDLDRLRQAHADQPLLLMLQGATTDAVSLHQFVAELGHDPLFEKAELVSLETNEENQSASEVQFKVRLTVRTKLVAPAPVVTQAPRPASEQG